MDRGYWRRNSSRNENYSNFQYANKLNDHFSNQRDHFQNQSRYDRSHYQSNSGRFDRHYNNRLENRNYDNRNSYQYKKPYDRHLGRGFSDHQNNIRQPNRITHSDDIKIPISPLDVKINTLLNAVQEQGIFGQLVFMANENDNSTSIFQNAIQTTKDLHLNVTLDTSTNKFQLTINDAIFGVTDSSKGKQIAKTELFEVVLNNLKSKCFYITKKDNFEEVSLIFHDSEICLENFQIIYGVFSIMNQKELNFFSL